MAKKNQKSEEIEQPTGNTVAALTTAGGFILPGNSFDDTQGETCAGLNILRLKQGEAAGPFVLKEILLNQKLGENKKMAAVNVYVATHNGVEIRMPIAAAFVKKAEAATLKVGDTFLVKRVEDYVAKKFGKAGCADYALKITDRAKK
jgi:hypothetical protein